MGGLCPDCGRVTKNKGWSDVIDIVASSFVCVRNWQLDRPLDKSPSPPASSSPRLAAALRPQKLLPLRAPATRVSQLLLPSRIRESKRYVKIKASLDACLPRVRACVHRVYRAKSSSVPIKPNFRIKEDCYIVLARALDRAQPSLPQTNTRIMDTEALNQIASREHSVETIRRNSEVMGHLRKLMVVNRGVRIYLDLFLI
ncbi:hypothetical protein BC936DRAFT_149174, partial [Jimgerdemannia flammicorona]